MSQPNREAMLDREHEELSIRRQCELLKLTRSGVYRVWSLSAKGADAAEVVLMRRIDEWFLRYPFLGSRRLTALLRAEGVGVNRKRMQRLMRQMGIAAPGPKPGTTRPAPGHRIYPYLLRGVSIDRPNQA